jgi:uncharacterized protein (DUF302 family)
VAFFDDDGNPAKTTGMELATPGCGDWAPLGARRLQEHRDMQEHMRRLVVGLAFTQAVSRLIKRLEEQGFAVLGAADLSRVLIRRFGRSPRHVVTIQACDPAVARVLIDQEPERAVFLPFTIAVSELEPDRSVVVAVDLVGFACAGAEWRAEHPDAAATLAASASRLGEVLDGLPRTFDRVA